MKIGILGGGVAGVSLGTFLDSEHEVTVLEAASQGGGLAGSHHFQGFDYDVGPHIIFSRNPKILEFMKEVGGDLLGQYTRSNQIWFKGKLIKYPFENFLGLLPEDEKRVCLEGFLENPYEDFKSQNMLQFFLKTFGEGITSTYLRPYNEKIWKFDPAFLDLQMVERIPKPPAQDVIDGADGRFKEGYTHQLFFYYPKQGGIQTFFNRMVERLPKNTTYQTGQRVTRVRPAATGWEVTTESKTFRFDHILNCMPLLDFLGLLDVPLPDAIQKASKRVRYNSMAYGLAVFKKDQAGNHFAFNVPEKDIVFHRLSKVNFIGDENPKDKSAFLFEVTYRLESSIARLSDRQISEAVVSGIEKMGFIDPKDLIGVDVKRVKYAYVIYDLPHRSTTDEILGFLAERNISCCGRFAENEYVNMDQVIERAQKLCERLNQEWKQ